MKLRTTGRRWAWGLASLGVAALVWAGSRETASDRYTVPAPEVVVRSPRPDATPWPMALLVLTRTEVADPPARGEVDASDIALIRRAGADLVDWIVDRTDGRLAPTVDVLVVDEPIRALDHERGGTYSVHPAHVPPRAVAALRPGAYATVLAWMRMPDSVPARGNAQTVGWLRGATFAFVFLRDARLVSWVGPQHELHHQLANWNAALGGPIDLPSNHPPSPVTLPDGRVIEPKGDTREDWYRHVLAGVPPTFWSAVDTHRREQHPLPATNVAWRGVAVAAPGVEGPSLVNDGRLDTKAQTPLAREPVEGWFGVQFEAPVEVARVVLTTGWAPGSTSYLPTRVTVRIDGTVVGTRGDGVTPLPERTVLDLAAPVDGREVRVTVLSTVAERGHFHRAVVREIEVYPAE